MRFEVVGVFLSKNIHLKKINLEAKPALKGNFHANFVVLVLFYWCMMFIVPFQVMVCKLKFTNVKYLVLPWNYFVT